MIALSFFLISSCKKHSDVSPATNLVGTWNETKEYDDANHNGVMDPGEGYAANDFVDKYNGDGTGVHTYSGTSTPFLWELVYNNTYIKFTLSGATESQYCLVQTLTSTSFIYKDTSTTFAGSPIDPVWYCYIKQ